MSSSPDCHRKVKEDGFVVIRDFLSSEEIVKYRAASEKLIEYAREGKWPHVRTRGKQFPPWPKNFSPDIWGITGLLDPDLKDLSYPFHDCYASDKILDVAANILKTERDGLNMELFNMLINPLTDFELDWHRDTIKPEATSEEEAELLLRDPFAGTQYNLPLTEDNCLIVVPGSHDRVRTVEEREKTSNNNRKGFITGQITVTLKPGDIVFYNNNILHRARYDSQNTRITLHGSYGRVGHGESRARGVLQHGVAEWLPRLETKNENLKDLKKRLELLAQKYSNVNLGYALDG